MCDTRPLLVLSILLVVLLLMPSGAHLLDMPNKLRLSADDYLTVQQIYRGWAHSGLVVVAALLATAALAYASRGTPVFRWALAAFLCLAASRALFLDVHIPRQYADGELDPAACELGFGA